MIREEIAKSLLGYAQKNPGMSFVEVERVFDEHGFEYKGNQAICHPRYPNIIIWSGWNEDATELLRTLLEGPLEMTPTSVLTYCVDAKMLAIPLVKKAINYKRPHWLPMTLSVERK
jgi:hypothetical protein